MAEFPLDLPPSNRQVNQGDPAADHDQLTLAVADLARLVGEALDGKAPTDHGHTGYAPTDHTHPVGDLETTGTPDAATVLWGDGRWAAPPTGDGSGAPADHTHPVGDLETTGTPDASTFLRGDGAWASPPEATAPTWTDVTDKPATFPPATHEHTGYVRTVNGAAPDAAGDVTVATDVVAVVVSDTPPADTSAIWLDTSAGV